MDDGDDVVRVTQRSAMKRIIGRAQDALRTAGVVVLLGDGTGMSKAVSCAEVLKRHVPLHQVRASLSRGTRVVCARGVNRSRHVQTVWTGR